MVHRALLAATVLALSACAQESFWLSEHEYTGSLTLEPGQALEMSGELWVPPEVAKAIGRRAIRPQYLPHGISLTVLARAHEAQSDETLDWLHAEGRFDLPDGTRTRRAHVLLEDLLYGGCPTAKRDGCSLQWTGELMNDLDVPIAVDWEMTSTVAGYGNPPSVGLLVDPPLQTR